VLGPLFLVASPPAGFVMRDVPFKHFFPAIVFLDLPGHGSIHGLLFSLHLSLRSINLRCPALTTVPPPVRTMSPLSVSKTLPLPSDHVVGPIFIVPPFFFGLAFFARTRLQDFALISN